MVDKELIEIWRNMLKPSISLWLLNTNYEEMGEQDKEEFERDFDEILDLALIGLKHKEQLSQEGTTKDATSDTISRQFEEIVVRYLPDDLCNYPEYKGKPYYSIKYIEDGECFVGFGTYKPEVLSQYLRDYFMPPAQPERKKGHWIEASVAGMPALYHEKCGAFVYAPNGKKGFNFCPNCGADMRGEQE